MYSLVYCLASGGLSECENLEFETIDEVKYWLIDRVRDRGLFDFIGYGMGLFTLNRQDLLQECIIVNKDFYWDNNGIIWKNNDAEIDICDFQYLNKDVKLVFDRNALDINGEEIYMFVNI